MTTGTPLNLPLMETGERSPEVTVNQIAQALNALAAKANVCQVSHYWPGIVPVNALVFRHVFTRRTQFPAAFAGSQVKSAQTTGSTNFLIRKAAPATPNTFTTVGEIAWDASDDTPAFINTPNPVVFEIGDSIAVFGAATSDATLGDIALHFQGELL